MYELTLFFFLCTNLSALYILLLKYANFWVIVQYRIVYGFAVLVLDLLKCHVVGFGSEAEMCPDNHRDAV